MQHKPQCTNCFIASCKWVGLYFHTPKISTSWFIFQCLLSFLHVVFTVIGTKVNWIEATHITVLSGLRVYRYSVAQVHHRGRCTQEGPPGRHAMCTTGSTIYTCKYICMYVYMCMHVYKRIFLHVHVRYDQKHLKFRDYGRYSGIHECVPHMCVHIHVCVHTYIHTYMYIHVCHVCICMYA